jgi:hypothetical protein
MSKAADKRFKVTVLYQTPRTGSGCLPIIGSLVRLLILAGLISGGIFGVADQLKKIPLEEPPIQHQLSKPVDSAHDLPLEKLLTITYPQYQAIRAGDYLIHLELLYPLVSAGEGDTETRVIRLIENPDGSTVRLEFIQDSQGTWVLSVKQWVHHQPPPGQSSHSRPPTSG